MKTLNPISTLNWCFSTLGCPELELHQMCELARDYGIQRLEIRFIENDLDLPNYFKKKFPSPSAVRSLFEKYEIQVISLDSSFHLINPTEQEKTDLLAFGEWATLLEVPRLRIFDGGKMSSPLSEAEKVNALETFSWWKDQKQKNNWKTEVMIETHGAVITSASVNSLSEAMNRPKNILWDTHHIWAHQKEQPEQTWKQIKSHVCHIHVKDGNGLDENARPKYTLLSEGQFPLEKLLTLFAQEKITIPVSIEWEKKWHPTLPPLEEALKLLKNKQWLLR